MDYLWVSKTFYHLLISQPPTHLSNSLPAPYRSPSILVKKSYWSETLIKLTAQVESGASIHAIFQLTIRRIKMFFSLKPSQSQGESSLKISARWGSSFRRCKGTKKQTDRLTHSLTDWCFCRVINRSTMIMKFKQKYMYH